MTPPPAARLDELSPLPPTSMSAALAASATPTAIDLIVADSSASTITESPSTEIAPDKNASTELSTSFLVIKMLTAVASPE